MKPVDPPPDLSSIDAELLGEPGLATALGVEGLLEGGVQSGGLHMDRNTSHTIPVLSSRVYTTCMEGVSEVPPKLIHEKLRELRGDLSRSKLVRRMPGTIRPDYEGVSENWVKAIESEPGKVPDADDLEAFAAVLGVDPSVFYEWPIAKAKREARDPAARVAAREGAAVHRVRADRQDPAQTKPDQREPGGQDQG